MIPKTSDGRLLFLYPWAGVTLAGTTDGPSEITDHPVPGEKEISYLIDTVNKYFNQSKPIKREDVIHAWSGIRPLKKANDNKDTAQISREHGVYISNSGLATIIGGKWTTYRSMALDIMTKLLAWDKPLAAHVQKLEQQQTGPWSTANQTLIGAANFHFQYADQLAKASGLSIDICNHLNQSYGDQAKYVADLATKSPELAKRIAPEYPYIFAEVVYGVENEYALTTMDVLARRTRLAFLDKKACQSAIPAVNSLMTKLLKWDQQQQQQDLHDANFFLNYREQNIVADKH